MELKVERILCQEEPAPWGGFPRTEKQAVGQGKTHDVTESQGRIESPTPREQLLASAVAEVAQTLASQAISRVDGGLSREEAAAGGGGDEAVDKQDGGQGVAHKPGEIHAALLSVTTEEAALREIGDPQSYATQQPHLFEIIVGE